MNDTSISWTNKSSNPIYVIDKVTGKRGHYCTKRSPGCANCYSEVINHKWGNGLAYVPINAARAEWVLNEKELAEWHKYEAAVVAGKKPPVKMFIGDMTDLFHPDVPAKHLDRLFQAMTECPHITFQLLTKRPERMEEVATTWAGLLGWVLPNVWLGTSVENQRWAAERIPILLRTPAAVRFLSMEPLLGPVDVRPYLTCHEGGCEWSGDVLYCSCHNPDLHWIILGGESGPHHRPMDHAWARTIRDACQAAGVAFWFKQSSAVRNEQGTQLHEADGQYSTWHQFPQTAVAA